MLTFTSSHWKDVTAVWITTFNVCWKIIININSYLDFLVDDEKEKLYLFYFMNDMAEESEITSFLQNMKENGAQESEDGMYRWMIED